MKPFLLLILPGVLISSVIGWIYQPAQTKKALFEKSELAKTAASTPIDGAWEIVWAKYNDKLQNPASSSQFKMFSNGIFSLFAQDSSGKLAYAGYGKYELDGNIYKETFIYHDTPRFRGGIDWQEYKLTGDTLYMKGFIKVIINGKDETAGFHKHEEKRVRVKW